MAAAARPYDVEASSPDRERHLQAYRERSARAYAESACSRDLAYGQHSRERFDFFPSAQSSDLVFVFLHGGYWKGGAKEDRAFLTSALCPAGWHFINAEYPIVPEAKFGAMVESVATLIAGLPAFLAERSIAKPRVVLAGNSAGAHLAASAVAMLDQAGAAADAVDGLILLSGVYDLAPLLQTEAQTWLALSQAEAERYSPINARYDRSRAFLVAVGDREPSEFHRQSLAFHRHLQEGGQESKFLVTPGDCHFSIIGRLTDPDSIFAVELPRLLAPINAI